MKRTLAAVVFIVSFAAYAVFRSPTSGTTSVPTTSPSNTSGISVVNAPTATPATPQATPATNSTAPAAMPKTAPATASRLGPYVDGAYTGPAANAYYGTVQVKVTINRGAISDVAFLSYPNDRSTSARISNYAMPILKSEALSAQSAEVNTVSGATEISRAFRISLAGALTQAS